MLIVVKPGMVLTSLRTICAGVAARAGSRRAPCRRSRSPGTPRSTAGGSRRRSAGGRSAGMIDPRSVVEVLRLVIVELARRDDLAGHRRLRVVVAEHRALDLARVGHRRFDDDLAVEASRRDPSPSRRLVAILRLRDADARSEVRRLDEHRKAERRCSSVADDLVAVPFPLVAQHDAVVADRQAARPRRPPSSAPCPCRAPMPATPAPTYGTFASSSRPWIVPSSPYGPCSTGKIDVEVEPGDDASAGSARCRRRALDREDRLFARPRDQMHFAAGRGSAAPPRPVPVR